MVGRLVLLTLLLSSRVAFAQQPNSRVVFLARVFDAADSGAVSGAMITVDGKEMGRTDGRGRFRAQLAAGDHELDVRFLGYQVFHARVALDDSQTELSLPLERVPLLLSQMTVHGRSMRVPAGFEHAYRRAAMSDGTFLTRELIDSVGTTTLPTLLRSQSNLWVRDNGSVSSARCGNFDIWLNGTLINDGRAAADIIADLPPSVVQAIEVYQGQARVPRELLSLRTNRPPTCGVLVLWTRVSSG